MLHPTSRSPPQVSCANSPGVGVSASRSKHPARNSRIPLVAAAVGLAVERLHRGRRRAEVFGRDRVEPGVPEGGQVGTNGAAHRLAPARDIVLEGRPTDREPSGGPGVEHGVAALAGTGDQRLRARVHPGPHHRPGRLQFGGLLQSVEQIREPGASRRSAQQIAHLGKGGLHREHRPEREAHPLERAQRSHPAVVEVVQGGLSGEPRGHHGRAGALVAHHQVARDPPAGLRDPVPAVQVKASPREPIPLGLGERAGGRDVRHGWPLLPRLATGRLRRPGEETEPRHGELRDPEQEALVAELEPPALLAPAGDGPLAGEQQPEQVVRPL